MIVVNTNYHNYQNVGDFLSYSDNPVKEVLLLSPLQIRTLKPRNVE